MRGASRASYAGLREGLSAISTADSADRVGDELLSAVAGRLADWPACCGQVTRSRVYPVTSSWSSVTTSPTPHKRT